MNDIREVRRPLNARESAFNGDVLNRIVANNQAADGGPKPKPSSPIDESNACLFPHQPAQMSVVDSDRRCEMLELDDATCHAGVVERGQAGGDSLVAGFLVRRGPLPAHYEPLESPERNVVYGRQTNPVASRLDRDDNKWADSPDDAYPYVLTTYRLTEHHTAGGMSRTLSRLAELQPALFCEISPELGGELRIRNGERVHIVTARGRIEAHALVTPRMRPIRLDGRVVHQVALPWHFGHRGLVAGDVANDLVAMSEEPNVRIMESKALVCRVERAASARRAGG